MHSDFSLLDSPATGMQSPSMTEITPPMGAAASPKGGEPCEFTPQSEVGTGLQPMTAEEREGAIRRAGIAMQAWYSQYQMTGQAAHLDCAYRCLGMMRELIAGRSKGDKQ